MVWLRREDHEDRELHWLCPWALSSRNAGGRRLPEPDDPLRTDFQRDRDRILHAAAFRRMQHKTQVMAAFEGDHFRSRMTHSLEVAQMSRCVARALRCNDDLAEAIALAHDLGHPPFGHVGEEALDEEMRDHGGFRHNAQGARIVDYLEDRYGHGHGLNLTLALRKSLLKGRIPDGFPLSPDLVPRGTVPFEAHIVDLCDKIAYLSHDLDDGLRAGLFTEAGAGELRLWQQARQSAGTTNRQRVVSDVTALLIHDLVESGDAAIAIPCSAKFPTCPCRREPMRRCAQARPRVNCNHPARDVGIAPMPCFHDSKSSAPEVISVEPSDRGVGFSSGRHLHEAEASGVPRFAIAENPR